MNTMEEKSRLVEQLRNMGIACTECGLFRLTQRELECLLDSIQVHAQKVANNAYNAATGR